MDEEAKTLASRAAEQAKHAAKNGERAIEFVAEDVAEDVARKTWSPAEIVLTLSLMTAVGSYIFVRASEKMGM